METIRKYAIPIALVTIFCILIIGNTGVFARGSEGIRKGDPLKQEESFSGALMAYDTALKIDSNYVNALDGKGWSLMN